MWCARCYSWKACDRADLHAGTSSAEVPPGQASYNWGTSRTPRKPGRRLMCGACAEGAMVSFQPADVVSYRAATGAPPRIGKVEELNKISGVGVLWESGERSWFAYDYWCPLREEDGWSMVLTTAEFTPAADCCTPCTDFVAAPEEELGRLRPVRLEKPKPDPSPSPTSTGSSTSEGLPSGEQGEGCTYAEEACSSLTLTRLTISPNPNPKHNPNPSL